MTSGKRKFAARMPDQGLQSNLRVVKPCPFCQGRVLPPEEWATGTWCCADQRRRNLG